MVNAIVKFSYLVSYLLQRYEKEEILNNGRNSKGIYKKVNSGK